MSTTTRNVVFRILVGASLAAAVLTLIPWPQANVTNDLSYKSLCPFAPWSSLSLVGFAGLLTALQSHLASTKDQG